MVTRTGIGAAVATAFALSGCTRIAITDINRAGLESTKSALLKVSDQIKVLEGVGDVSDVDFVDSFMESVFATFSRIDYAVNCAGVDAEPTRSVNTPVADFDRVNNINYKGCWLSSRAEIRHMLKQEPLHGFSTSSGWRGSIVNIASQLGLVARAGSGT